MIYSLNPKKIFSIRKLEQWHRYYRPMPTRLFYAAVFGALLLDITTTFIVVTYLIALVGELGSAVLITRFTLFTGATLVAYSGLFHGLEDSGQFEISRFKQAFPETLRWTRYIWFFLFLIIPTYIAFVVGILETTNNV